MGCIASGLLALGTKEIAATLPVFIFLYEWYFFQNLDGRWLRRRVPVLIGAAAAGAVIGLFYLGFGNPLERIFSGYDGIGASVCQRLMTQLPVVGFYIRPPVWPGHGEIL